MCTFPFCGSGPGVEGPQTQVEEKLDRAQKQRAEQTQVQDFEWKLFQAGVPSAFTLES